MASIRFPTGFSIKNALGWGLTGITFLDLSSNTVIKYPRNGEQDAMEVEKKIHERFQQHGGHEGLLKYDGPFELGIRLEYASKHGLLKYIQDQEINIDAGQRVQWAQQIASALVFIHSLNVVHGDLTCGNVVLDDKLHAKVIDFGGSSLDGSDLLAVVTASHRHAGKLKSSQADLFALGSTLHEIMTGKAPYDGFTDMDINTLFRQSKFPDTKSLGQMGDVIMGGWRGRFVNAIEVLRSIEAIQPPYRYSFSLPSLPSPETTLIAASILGLLAFLVTRLATH